MEDSRQIIYPTERLLANPRIFQAIANFFGDGPDWEVFAGAFYDLIEGSFLEDEDEDPDLMKYPEVAFREKPEEPEVFQVIVPDGTAIELRPAEGGSRYSAIASEDELGVVSAIYGRLIKAIEVAQPDLKGDVVLCDPPTPSNGYLRSEDGDKFEGEFHLLSDPEKMYDFVVDVVDMEKDDLRATVKPR